MSLMLDDVGLTHANGFAALSGIKLSVNQGESIALIGPSGAGKTSLLNTSVWDKLVESKKVDTSKVRVFATTPTYFDYNWTVRGDLDPAIVKKLTDAFLALDPSKPEHKAIMELQRASKFIPTKPENYEGTEMAAKSAGLLK